MKFIQKYLSVILAAFAMLVLILDAKTALAGAQDGVELCLRSVIPSLFPFLLLSAIISQNAIGIPIRLLRPLGELLGIPSGAEYLLILSLLGGYPVGAQAVTQAWEGGSIRKSTAKRLLGFCSNAGPAFIFGMVGTSFSDPLVAWVLWIIHFGSSLLVGLLLPEKDLEVCIPLNSKRINFSQIFTSSLRSMACICGWVVLFRTMIRITECWFLWLLPQPVQILICSLFELSNGCIMLTNLPTESVRFLLSCVMLSFGGLCVFMQTRTVTGHLNTGMYFPGKLLQAMISFFLASILQHFLFPSEGLFHLPVIGYVGVFCSGMVLLYYLNRRKKVVAMSV